MKFKEYLNEGVGKMQGKSYVDAQILNVIGDRYEMQNIRVMLRKKHGDDWWKKYENKSEKELKKIFGDMKDKY